MDDSDQLDEELPRRRTAQGEHRWPPAIAVVVAALTYAFLPNQILFTQRWIVPGLELLLLVALVASDPIRMTRESRWSRQVSVALAGVIIVTNLIALGQLVANLPSKSADNNSLLLGGMQVWLTGVIGFGLLYWELDRGGPVARRKLARADLPPADWRFSQDENDDAVTEVKVGASGVSGWIPTFLDYSYMSLTNSSAFSPTDTMPLSSRAKCLMAVQATAALLTSLLVVAKAVGSLGGGG